MISDLVWGTNHLYWKKLLLFVDMINCSATVKSLIRFKFQFSIYAEIQMSCEHIQPWIFATMFCAKLRILMKNENNSSCHETEEWFMNRIINISMRIVTLYGILSYRNLTLLLICIRFSISQRFKMICEKNVQTNADIIFPELIAI